MEAVLRAGARSLGLELSEASYGQLLDYLDLIQKWTKVYNLTAVRDPAEMLTHHLLDSLAVVAPLQRQLAVMRAAGNFPPPGQPRLLDVGSGAGLPGVVLAICCPELLVHCVDTVAKKAAFIQQVASSLKLTNLRGIHNRVEKLDQHYDLISSRAFASLEDFVNWSVLALAPQGIWLAMKGKYPKDELERLPALAQVFHVEPLRVPGLDAERCIVWMRHASPNC